MPVRSQSSSTGTLCQPRSAASSVIAAISVARWREPRETARRPRVVRASSDAGRTAWLLGDTDIFLTDQTTCFLSMSSDSFARRCPTGARQAPAGPPRTVRNRHEALPPQAMQQPRGLRRMAVPERPLDLRAAGTRLLEQYRKRPRACAPRRSLPAMARARQQRGRAATLSQDRRLNDMITAVALPLRGQTPQRNVRRLRHFLAGSGPVTEVCRRGRAARGGRAGRPRRRWTPRAAHGADAP